MPCGIHCSYELSGKNQNKFIKLNQQCVLCLYYYTVKIGMAKYLRKIVLKDLKSNNLCITQTKQKKTHFNFHALK